MSRQVHFFERPRRFVAGTVGTPGERTFYLQAADAQRVVSVSLEKQQVAVLADRLEQLLDDVVTRTGTALPAAESDSEALEQPIDEEFRVGAMGLAWDGDTGLIVIEAQAPVEDAETAQETLLEDVAEGPDALRVLIEPRRARAFVARARRVISAGRPPCPLCGQPLESTGHVCPRQNGYHRSDPLGT
ncbi:MAG: DUF3090 family protein [Jatrophihabitantaceae bacterium]